MNTITVSAVTALIAAGVNLAEQFPAGVNIVPDNAAAIPAPVTEVVTPAKADGRNKAARAHNFEARMVRRESTKTTAKGLTKGEKSALYAALRETTQLAAPKPASWTRIVTAYKAAEATTGVSVAEFCAEWVVVNAAI